MLSREDREIMDRLISGEHPMTSDTPPDQPAAPDEDAAVRELAMIISPSGTADPQSAAGVKAKWAIAEGWTRRPVDTRPTRSELKSVIQAHVWVSDRIANNAIDAMIEAGYATPDPAPAAEVPVFASVEEAEARDPLYEVPPYMRSQIEKLTVIVSELRDRVRNLELAALTKATDR